MVTQVVCVGPTGSGKTSLLNTLQNKAENATVAQDTTLVAKTIPTVGANHFTSVKLDLPQSYLKSKAKQGLQVTEYGGQLAPLWTTYLRRHAGPLALIFVADCSDVSRIAETAVHLVELLESTDRPFKSVLIVYSKIDLLKTDGGEFKGDRVRFDRKRLNEFRQLLRIRQIKSFYGAKLDLNEVEYSAVNGQGLAEIRYWLHNL